MSYKIRSLLSMVCMSIALVPMASSQAPAPGANAAGPRLRFGDFSIVWPAQPHLVRHQRMNIGELSIYAVTLAPVTFTLSMVSYSSPQMMVSPADFAHNMTANENPVEILWVGRDQLAGYPADKVLYRSGRLTTLAWSIQPMGQLNYVLTVAGFDGPQFRNRAEQFVRSLRVEPKR